MRYVPSTQHGSLIMSSIRQAAKDACGSSEATAKAVSDALKLVEVHETGTRDYAAFVKANADMSAAFDAWITAIKANDPQAAAKAEATLDQVAHNHPFSYYDTRRIYESYYQHVGYEASKQNYDAQVKNGGGVDCGMVTAKLPADAKVAILGDWGTGEDDANALVKAMLARKPDVILHLGDVYDAALPLENEEHFLKPINDACTALGMPRPPIFSIPGNHEYYSGAKGFFQLIDVLNHGIGGTDDWMQRASFFCLQSEDGKWQFLGADTGLQCTIPTLTDAPGIEPGELAWHRQQIKGFQGKTVFMTHHQLLSADMHISNEPGDGRYTNPQLVDGLADCFDDIDLWLWGHDHWFTSYENATVPSKQATDPVLKRGQLMGGSGRETTKGQRQVHDHLLGTWVVADPNDAQKSLQPHLANTTKTHGRDAEIYNHTYAILDLATGVITYYEVPGWVEDDLEPYRNSPAPIQKDELPQPLYHYTI